MDKLIFDRLSYTCITDDDDDNNDVLLFITRCSKQTTHVQTKNQRSVETLHRTNRTNRTNRP